MFLYLAKSLLSRPPFLWTVFIECSYLILRIYPLAILCSPTPFLRLLSSLSCTSPIPSSQLPHSARSVYGRISSLMLSLVLLVQLFILLSSVEHCFYVNLCRVYPYVRCYWLLFVLAFWSFVCQFVTVRVNGHLDVACHSPNNMFNL